MPHSAGTGRRRRQLHLDPGRGHRRQPLGQLRGELHRAGLLPARAVHRSARNRSRVRHPHGLEQRHPQQPHRLRRDSGPAGRRAARQRSPATATSPSCRRTPIDNNLIDGGPAGSVGYCAYGGSTTGKPFSAGVNNIMFTNNIFKRGNRRQVRHLGPDHLIRLQRSRQRLDEQPVGRRHDGRPRELTSRAGLDELRGRRVRSPLEQRQLAVEVVDVRSGRPPRYIFGRGAARSRPGPGGEKPRTRRSASVARKPRRSRCADIAGQADSRIVSDRRPRSSGDAKRGSRFRRSRRYIR